MSGLLDVLGPILPPGLGPIAAAYADVIHAARQLFGTGETPRALPPPPLPPPAPPTDGTGPTQDEIDKLNQQIAQLQEQIAQAHQGGVNATDESGDNSKQGRQDTDGILNEGTATGALLGAQQGTPEGQAAALQAMQRQIDALTQNVQEKATNAGGIADALRNLGAGMPAMGMPSMGLPAMGMPALPPFGGLGTPPVAPVAAPPQPVISMHPADDQQGPPPVRTTTPSTTEPAGGDTDIKPTTPPVTTTPAAPPSQPDTSPPPITTATPGAPVTTPPPAPAAAGKQITLPSGQVVTAPNEAAAAAVRTALTQPAGHGDVASTAYSATGVSLPTDGAEPGRKIDPADLKPGDIAVFDDHTALVAGNGQLVGPDGKLQPLGIINDANNFHGFYRPTETADIPAVQPHEPAGMSATTPHTATPSAAAPGATLAAAPALPGTAGHPAATAAPGPAPAAAQPAAAPMPLIPAAVAAAAKPATPAPPPPPASAHDR